MLAIQEEVAIALPSPIRSLEETGLPFALFPDLIVKILYFHGAMVGRYIASRICLPFLVLEPAIKFLTDEGLIDSKGMQNMSYAQDESLGAGMLYALSKPGRLRARELIELNQYAGPVPVAIEDYLLLSPRQVSTAQIDRQQMERAYSKLVLSGHVFDALGPAICARQAMFVYGSPGNGKSTVTEGIVSFLGPPIFVPHSLYVHGEIIEFFDPAYHAQVSQKLPEHDQRWKLVNRPVVQVGGELTGDQLELGYDPNWGFYQAPLQLKANGGLLIIDDFGRQNNLAPQSLLNRLIVPLEKKIDYLHIARAGMSVAVPFTTFLILSTNLAIKGLMDEAFLRRVHFKVRMPNPTEEQYRKIWETLCLEHKIQYNDELITDLLINVYQPAHRELRGVHPRDLLIQMQHIAVYEGIDLELNAQLLELACATYFVDA